MITGELLNDQEVFKNDNALLNESLKSAVKSALVEKFSKGDERPCNEDDFSETRENREKVTSDIQVLLENRLTDCESKNKRVTLDNEVLALLLILCGQNTSLHPWNTEATKTNCEGILLLITKFFQCKDLSELLTKTFKTTLTKIFFQTLCPELTVATWKYSPASVACYEWILKRIEQPDLSQHLHFVLPPSLLLIDDYINENKITGTKCLNHIINNITVAELQFCGHGNVIYSALIPLLRIREADLINSLIPPLVSITTKLEFDFGTKDITKWSKFDDILEIFLENMEMEQLISLRDCYIANLGLIVKASGFRIIRWSKRLLRIFHEYISTANKLNYEKTINCCLKVIEEYIEMSSEIIPLYSENLLATLLYALHSTRDSKTAIQTESKEITIKCINVLLRFISESERGQVVKLIQEKFSITVISEGSDF